MGMFPTDVLARHDVTPNLADIESTFAEIYRLVWSIDEQVRKADTATGEKVVNPFDSAAEKDFAAKNDAADIVSEFLEKVATKIEANPHVAWHLAQIDKRISSFMTSEVGFYRWQESKRTGVKGSDDSQSELREDRRVLVDLLRKLFALDEDGLSKIDGVKTSKGKNGNVLLDLPSIKGPRGGDGNPTGKFSKLYYVQWTVDGEHFPAGTDSRMIIRFVWTGTDRTDKRPGDLYDAWTAAKGNECKPGESVTFTLNGKTVVATMVEDED